MRNAEWGVLPGIRLTQWTGFAVFGERRKRGRDADSWSDGRARKNAAFGYSEIQAKLREATSVDCNGPSTGQLHELAAATNHPYRQREERWLVTRIM